MLYQSIKKSVTFILLTAALTKSDTMTAAQIQAREFPSEWI